MQGVVLMMNFMHFVEKVNLMEKSMQPVEEKVFGKENDDQLD